MEEKAVSIIIVNYNTCKMTMECIDSVLFYTTGITYEIIVVDNASSDNSASTISQKYTQVKVLSSPKNLGFGGANNMGVKSARGKFLFFLNSDTLLLNNAVKEMYDFWKKNEQLRIGVLGGILVDKTRKEFESFSCFPTVVSEIGKYIGLKSYVNRYVARKKQELDNCSYAEVDYVSGADMFMEKSTFESINGFDTTFFMYFEESDMQKRLHRCGMKNYILTTPHILHYGGASQGQVSNKKRMMVHKSMMVFLRRYTNVFAFYLFKFVFILLECLKSLRGKYTYEESKEFLWMLCKA